MGHLALIVIAIRGKRRVYFARFAALIENG